MTSRLHGWLTLARISNSPTVISNVLAGAALGGVLQPNRDVGLLVIAMVLFYTAGMVLNDVCDYGWDRQHRPTRPLPSGLIPRWAAAAAVAGLFLVGLLVLGIVHTSAVLSGVVLIGVIAFYDAWHKSNPLSPVVMALCRVMVYVTVFVAFNGTDLTALGTAAVLLVLYMTGLTAIAKSEVRPSMTGYWPAVLLFLGPIWYALAGSIAAAILGVASVAWIAFSIRSVYRTQKRDIGSAIARLIAGISLFDALVLASHDGLALVPLALAAFGLTLFFQHYVEGT